MLFRSTIFKIEATTKIKSEYTNHTNGSISSFDVTNPLKILLFYKEKNSIILLDNQLAEIQEPIILDELGHHQVTLVATSNKGGFWIYDNERSQLLRYNSKLEKQTESNSLLAIIEPKDSPNFLGEYNGNVYLNFPNLGIFVFDLFGNYINTIALLNLDNFQIHNNSITYLQDNNLLSYNIFDQTTTTIDLSDTLNILEGYILNNKIYLFKPESYKIIDLTKKKQ